MPVIEPMTLRTVSEHSTTRSPRPLNIFNICFNKPEILIDKVNHFQLYNLHFLRMAIGSAVLFFKQLSVEDVPYAFTYGDTVVAYTRFFVNQIENSEIPGAAEFVEKSISKTLAFLSIIFEIILHLYQKQITHLLKIHFHIFFSQY